MNQKKNIRIKIESNQQTQKKKMKREMFEIFEKMIKMKKQFFEFEIAKNNETTTTINFEKRLRKNQ